MLQRISKLRKVAQLALQNAPCLSQEFLATPVAAPVASTSCRQFSNLPTDHAKLKVVMPVRALRKQETASQPQSVAEQQTSSSSNVSSGPSTAAVMQQGAQTGDQVPLEKLSSFNSWTNICYRRFTARNLTKAAGCSYCLDVSLGETTDARRRHKTKDLGEAVLGCLCHSYQFVLVQQTQARCC